MAPHSLGTTRERIPKNPKHSTAYVWRLVGPKALILLRKVRPYLVIERKSRKVDILDQGWEISRAGLSPEDYRSRKLSLVEAVRAI